MMMNKKLICLIFLISFFSVNFAEQTGSFNDFLITCNNNIHCDEDKLCFFYYSNTSIGQCNDKNNIGCVNDGNWVLEEETNCKNSTHEVECRNGKWKTPYKCDNGCSGNKCRPDPTNTPDSSSGIQSPLLKITKIEDFNLIQGNFSKKSITIENIGNVNVIDVLISISGIDSSWYTIDKKIFDKIEPKTSKTVNIHINIPEDAQAKDYTLKYDLFYNTFKISNQFKIKVLAKTKNVIKKDLIITPTETKKIEINESKNETKTIEAEKKNYLLHLIIIVIIWIFILAYIFLTSTKKGLEIKKLLKIKLSIINDKIKKNKTFKKIKNKIEYIIFN